MGACAMRGRSLASCHWDPQWLAVGLSHTSTQGVSEALGNPSGEGASSAPAMKAGTSHNPEKGKQSAQGKAKQPAQGETPTDTPLQPGGRVTHSAGRAGREDPPGEYVDMADLLRDNVEAERRRGAVTDNTTCTGGGGGGAGKGKRREIPDLLSWVQCFGVYACVVASQHPKRICELMAYQTTIIREARRCGGAGWQGYDSMFRQHAANLPNIDWSKVNNSLFTVTFMAQQNGRGKTCELCLDPDHVAAECALAPAKPSEPPPPRQPVGLGGMQQASAVLAPAGNGGIQ